MDTSLLPWITGGGGAISVLLLVLWLLIREELVIGRQHKRDLATIRRQDGVIETLETANDSLRDTVSKQASQIDRLLDGSALSNTLAQALVSVAQQPSPRRRRQREPDHSRGVDQENTEAGSDAPP